MEEVMAGVGMGMLEVAAPLLVKQTLQLHLLEPAHTGLASPQAHSAPSKHSATGWFSHCHDLYIFKKGREEHILIQRWLSVSTIVQTITMWPPVIMQRSGATEAFCKLWVR